MPEPVTESSELKDLELDVCSKLDEWSFLPGVSHDEDCDIWDQEDCNCSSAKEVEAWKKCSAEVIQLIADRIARERQKAVEDERREIKKLWGNLRIQFGASAGSAIGATYTNDFDESFDFQLDRDAVKSLLDRLATQSNKGEAVNIRASFKQLSYWQSIKFILRTWATKKTV